MDTESSLLKSWDRDKVQLDQAIDSAIARYEALASAASR